MTDYTELIRSLRNCSNNRCAPCDCGWFDKYQVDESCKEIIMWKAAAAIEELEGFLAEAERDRDEYEERMRKEQERVIELQAEVKRLELDNEDYEHEQRRLKGEIEALQAQLPKRGEWIRKDAELYYWHECSKCGERPLYDRYANKVLSAYCPNCGAKMEVQDGQ